MKIPCSVALVLAAGSPQGGAGFTASTAVLRNAGGAAHTASGNMRMAGTLTLSTEYVCTLSSADECYNCCSSKKAGVLPCKHVLFHPLPLSGLLEAL